jgi:hypothetical protein
MNPRDECLSLTDHFHIGVWDGFSGDSFGMSVFFNNAEYGPYRGSIMSISDEKAPAPKRWGWSVLWYGFSQETEFDRQGNAALIEKACDLPGIYFRHFRQPDKADSLWTLMISLGYPLLLFSILPVAWIFRRMRAPCATFARLTS